MKLILNASIDSAPDGSIKTPCYQSYFLNILVNLGYSFVMPPLANLLKNLHSLDGNWVVVSPVNWQVTHNDSMIVAAAYDFSLTPEQSDFLFAKFSEFVSGEGMELYKHDDVTWLMKVADKPSLNAKSVYSILHNSIMPTLVNLDPSLYWQKFLTMSQMFLSNLRLPEDKNNILSSKLSMESTKQSSSMQSIYPINGVWVWGGGNLLPASGQQIIALDEKSMQIAQVLSKNYGSYPTKRISKNAIFLANSFDKLQILAPKYLSKINYWYWNNQAYQFKPKFSLKNKISLLRKSIVSIYKGRKCVLNKKN